MWSQSFRLEGTPDGDDWIMIILSCILCDCKVLLDAGPLPVSFIKPGPKHPVRAVDTKSVLTMETACHGKGQQAVMEIQTPAGLHVMHDLAIKFSRVNRGNASLQDTLHSSIVDILATVEKVKALVFDRQLKNQRRSFASLFE